MTDNKQIFIAEVKTHSPFGWHAEKTWEELFDVANEHGDWLSIHTDENWQGSFELISRARDMTDKPILAKGIHKSDEEISRAIELGADYALVVGRIPGVYVEQCLIEVIDADQIFDLPDTAKVVWNQRNLSNGQRKHESFEKVRHIWSNWLAQASFIRTIEDVSPSATAFIVGTHLVDFVADFQRQ